MVLLECFAFSTDLTKSDSCISCLMDQLFDQSSGRFDWNVESQLPAGGRYSSFCDLRRNWSSEWEVGVCGMGGQSYCLHDSGFLLIKSWVVLSKLFLLTESHCPPWWTWSNPIQKFIQEVKSSSLPVANTEHNNKTWSKAFRIQTQFSFESWVLFIQLNKINHFNIFTVPFRTKHL